MSSEVKQQSAQPKTSPQAGDKFPQISFLLEFSGPQNEKIAWPMSQIIVRGRWKGEAVRKIGGAEQTASISDLPGMMLYFDSSKKSYVIYDPLNQPKNKEAAKKHTDQIIAVYGMQMAPEQEYFFDNLSENAMKTVCYLARRLLDNNQVVVHSGEIPNVDLLEQLPGVIEFTSSHLDSGMQAVRIESLKNYRSARDTGKKREPTLSIDIPILQ